MKIQLVYFVVTSILAQGSVASSSEGGGVMKRLRGRSGVKVEAALAETAKEDIGVSVDEDQNNGNTSDDVAACIARCRRLRFTQERQMLCIQACENGDEPPAFFDESFDNDFEYPLNDEKNKSTEKQFVENDFTDVVINTDPSCVQNCKRKRFVGSRMDACVRNCGVSGMTTEDVKDTNADSLEDEKDEGTKKQFVENDFADVAINADPGCIQNCKRKRFAGSRMDACVRNCGVSGMTTEDVKGAAADADANATDEAMNDQNKGYWDTKEGGPHYEQDARIGEYEKDIYELESIKNVDTNTYVAADIDCIRNCRRKRWGKSLMDECVRSCDALKNRVEKDGYYVATH